jgi:thiamine biosynthesis lipoprotein
MTSRALLSLGILLAPPLWIAASLRSGVHMQTFYREDVLGTSFEMKVVARDPAHAAEAEAAALQEIGREAKILSSYDPQSEFSRWFATRGQGMPVSPELFHVLDLFDTWRTRTGGALDAAAEAIVQVWKRAASSGRLPAQAELAAAVQAVRQPHWQLDFTAHTATHLDATPLALNSFVKSYILDHAARAALASKGVTALVLNLGGDLVVRGDWSEPVQIADPLSSEENAEPIARILVRDQAVATSGNYRRGVEIGGRHYSHIVDPRTGRTAEHILSSTVVSRDPVEAGALATAFSVLTPEESRQLAAKAPGVEFLLIPRNGGRIASPGWSQLETAFLQVQEAKPKLAGGAARQEPGLWDPEFELEITLQLRRFEEGRARRPYVAVWIEDKDQFPVRTLALWFQKARWLPELRAWYRDDRVRAKAQGSEITASVSSATRPPGKYTLKWDGKDDKGNLVKAGAYTICFEAVREHGTYQIIRQEMDFNGVPKHVPLSGNAEIESASLDYRKASAH